MKISSNERQETFQGGDIRLEVKAEGLGSVVTYVTTK